MAKVGIERGGFFDSEQQGRESVVAEIPIGHESDYSRADYQAELTRFLSSSQPQEIQVAISFLGEQIKQKETSYQEAINPHRENWRRLEEEEIRLKHQKGELRGRIAQGEKTRGPTGGDFAEEVKIVSGRIQVKLWEWKTKPPNFFTKVLGRAFSFWARPIHPLIVQRERKQELAVQAKRSVQESLNSLTRQHTQEVAALNSAKQKKEQELSAFLDNWSLENPHRFIFHLAENPRKIPALLEIYLHRATATPGEEESLAYLYWGLEEGFSLSSDGKEFDRWLQNFLPQKRKEEWQRLLGSDQEELTRTLRENLGNFGAFLSFNSRARQDFRQFLKWRLGENLKRAGVDLKNPLPHPYFLLAELPKTETFFSPGETGEKRPLELVIGGRTIHGEDETGLKETLEKLTGQRGELLEGIVKTLRGVYADLSAGRRNSRIKKLATPVGEANYSLRMAKWRILIYWRGDILEIKGVEHRRQAYR